MWTTRRWVNRTACKTNRICRRSVPSSQTCSAHHILYSISSRSLVTMTTSVNRNIVIYGKICDILKQLDLYARLIITLVIALYYIILFYLYYFILLFYAIYLFCFTTFMTVTFSGFGFYLTRLCSHQMVKEIQVISSETPLPLCRCYDLHPDIQRLAINHLFTTFFFLSVYLFFCVIIA